MRTIEDMNKILAELKTHEEKVKALKSELDSVRLEILEAETGLKVGSIIEHKCNAGRIEKVWYRYANDKPEDVCMSWRQIKKDGTYYSRRNDLYWFDINQIKIIGWESVE